MANLTKDKRFKKDYSKRDIIDYLKGIEKILGRVPSSRELKNFPGPAPSTVTRRFRLWSNALKEAGMRPQTHQLLTGERSFIRMNWREMTDKEIANKLGVTEVVIKYYRMNYNLWKNRKGTSKSTYRKRAFKLYGEKCEICGIEICEWHHIKPKSIDPKDWCILCPLCHAVVTKKLIIINNREDLKSKLMPFIKEAYKAIDF
ncbi:MAG: hypothetical protein Q7R97_02690 [Candidatus Daviesbacteria bacterium]|nr:hypothetical protein [Candidatus Daviesbacteria bacterium]